MKDLAIIIVTFNSEKDIENVIDSVVRNTKKINYEIIVVDNDSKDNTLNILQTLSLKYDKIKIIKSENKGFNYANNIGIKSSKAKYIALLNPDTILLDNTFLEITTYLEKNKNIAICGPRILDGNKKPNLTYIYFPSIKDHILRIVGVRNQKTTLLLNPKKREYIVDSPTGACFVFRKNLINEIGYMDEKYFLYFDEADFAKRALCKGYKNCVLSDISLIHLQGQSTASLKEKVIEYNIKSYTRFILKFYPKNIAKLIFLIFKLENFVKYICFKLIKNKRCEYYQMNNFYLESILKKDE